MYVPAKVKLFQVQLKEHFHRLDSALYGNRFVRQILGTAG